MTNFSAAHESRSELTGKARFIFPENHIEADNRLSWQLGELDKHYGKNAFYVHLKRDQEATAKSFMTRFLLPKSMIYAYANGIKKSPPEIVDRKKRYEICLDYVDTVNLNIEAFLKDKPQQMKIEIENIHSDFKNFWQHIKAEGDFDLALSEFDKKHNRSAKNNLDIAYSLKHAILKSKLFLDQLFTS